MIELYELFEKVKVPFVSVFYRIPPSPEQLKQIQAQLQEQMAVLKAEMEVKLRETQASLMQQAQEGKILPERAELELRKARDEMDTQLQAAEHEAMAKLQEATSKIENTVISKRI